MKKLILSVLSLSLILAPIPAKAQNGVGACPFNASSLVSAYKEMLTVSTTALPFTRTVYRPTNGKPPAVCATVVVNTNSISWWSTGATPTAADGIITPTAGVFSVGSTDLTKFLMIRAGASDAEVAVLYFTFAQ